MGEELKSTPLVEGEEAQIPEPKRKDEPEYRPRTALGKRLMEIRKKIVDSGVPLLDWEEIEREKALRRGETE